MSSASLVTWQPHLSLGVTGHRNGNAAFDANRERVEAAICDLFEQVGAALAALPIEYAPVRLHSLLASGVDQMVAERALERGWDLVAPLPFGAGLNLAINGEVKDPEAIAALVNGGEAAANVTSAEVDAIRRLMGSARVFEIADRDEEIRAAYIQSLADPGNTKAQQKYQALRSENAALAGRVMLERSDILIAVWDRLNVDLPGGTGHTILAALQQGTPAVVIDANAPDRWSLLTRPEELGQPTGQTTFDADHLRSVIETAMAPQRNDLKAIAREKWRARSSPGFGIYRRIESIFGGRSARSGTTKSEYEAPEEIALGTAAPVIEQADKVLAENDALLAKLKNGLFPLFAWADAVSGRLSDAYRSSMSINFILSAFAIIAGIAYLPFDLSRFKWIFASVELGLLLAIIAITYAGNKRAWHRRWFETRRVAEYLRFAPGLLLMGVTRPMGRWPRGQTRQWPERFSRDALRDAGLPQARIDRSYLRSVLGNVVLPHVKGQRSYHEAKARQLETVHRRIDRSADTCFLAALVSVSIYLLIELGALAGLVPATWPYDISKAFTFMGVAFPTLGANLAGIRYFGDFERFAGISEATATKLREVETRIELLLGGEEKNLTYRSASDLVRMVDEVVFTEIESWQAVYGSKALALPA